MTDKEWEKAIADIQYLRFQLTRNILPAFEREEYASRLKVKLKRLASRDQP
jgi:hypothetical protein